MDSEARYFKLGAFVLVAVGIAVAAIVVLGAGTLFQKRFTVETYMDESIQGLDVGAPVKYRGVRIGDNCNATTRLALRLILVALRREHPPASGRRKDGSWDGRPLRRNIESPHCSIHSRR